MSIISKLFPRTKKIKPLCFPYSSSFGILLKNILKQDTLSNGLFISGLLTISFGAWLAYPPAGFIICGTSMVLLGWLLS